MTTVQNIAPAAGAEAVTPSDSAVIVPTRALYVGAAGDLRVELLDGSTVTFSGIAAGVLHPLQVRRVYSTGTTSTGIVAVR
ncbi:MAG: spike base protein, RCAP_Rcc01079 family [Candidatus Promineifilaceae bacterium]